jgi:Regulator of chromosome condensation (RCC1) repeat
MAQVTAGWKHNAAITAAGELLSWGWGGSAGTQVRHLRLFL